VSPYQALLSKKHQQAKQKKKNPSPSDTYIFKEANNKK
jgi:hypothetical protein